MKRSILCLLILAGFLAACRTEPQNRYQLSRKQRGFLEDTRKFREIRSAAGLPDEILALFGGRGHIADPGQDWNATDDVLDPKLPWVRLIWAAENGSFYVVHYEHGGYVHSYHFLLAQLEPGGEAKILWRGSGFELKNYWAFVSALREYRIDDDELPTRH